MRTVKLSKTFNDQLIDYIEHGDQQYGARVAEDKKRRVLTTIRTVLAASPSIKRRDPALGLVVYLCAVMDWFSRRILAWRLSNTMEAEFCVETLENALGRHKKPGIFNTDQGSQFSGTAFTGVLIRNDISISMDGKGAWRDNVFVERFWRSVKYEEVYLRAYDDVPQARTSIGRYLEFYNTRRPHTALDRRTPDQAYFDPLPLRMAA